MAGGRIIRSQYFGTQPVVVGTNGRVIKSDDPEIDSVQPYMSDEEYQSKLASIIKREKLAEEKLKDAEEQSEIIIQSAEDEKKTTIDSANEVAKKMIDDASERADRMLDDAEKEIKRATEQARKEGHAEGVQQGIEDGKKQGEDLVRQDMADIINQANAQAQHTLETAKNAAGEYMVQAEENIVRIILAGIEKILPQHFIDVPQVILPFVQNAVARVKDQKEVKVHVPAEAYDLVLMARDEFRAQLTDGTATLEVVADEALKPGDCVIETPNGGVDARLQTQIEIVKQSIIDMLPTKNKFLPDLPFDISLQSTTEAESDDQETAEQEVPAQTPADDHTLDPDYLPPEEQDRLLRELEQNLDAMDIDIDETGMSHD